jgi:hypothetical protein
VFLFVGARGFEQQDGDAAGWDVVAAEVGDEALELLEPAGAAVVGVEVYGAAVDAGFEDARGVVEDVEDDALLLGELVELLADVVEEGVGGGDEVEQIGSNVCRPWSMTGCADHEPEPAPSPCAVA